MQASLEPIPSKADSPTCRRPAAFFSALLLTLCPASQAATITGMVVRVADGNTVTVLDADEVQHKIRLDGIDASEKAQPYGQQSKQSLSDMVFGKTVTVDTGKTDRYGREVGKVLVDGVDANLEQLKRGLAWHYKTYEREQSPEDRSLCRSRKRRRSGPPGPVG